jgi:hypothetical protein
MPDATIIIASRIGSGILRKTLDSLTCQRTGRSVEIAPADNGSTDGARTPFEAVPARRPASATRAPDRKGRLHAWREPARPARCIARDGLGAGC